MVLTDKLKHYKHLWNLSGDGDPFTTHSSLLQPVLYEGMSCILKIANGQEERRGNSLMVWWNGNGAAKVLLHDEDALLIERSFGKNSLTDMAKNGNDDQASRIICIAVAKLHAQKKPLPDYLVPLPLWFRDLKPAAQKYGGIFTQCRQIADGLLNEPIGQVVLHGDIHHGNILDFGARGWLAIDPKGLLGERSFDYANLLCNPDTATATMPGRLERQVKIVSDEAELHPNRMMQWVAAWAGLSAAWSIEDGAVAEPALTVAQIALRHI